MPSTQAFGPYELIERVKAGSATELFRAQERSTGRAVALKRILGVATEDDEFVQLFCQEARLASQLDHPNLAKIYEVGKYDQTYFVAYELVNGKELRGLLDRATVSEPVPIDVALFIATQVACGLEYAHDVADARGKPLGLLHRNLCPENILISFDGDVKLIDFGLAAAMGKLSRTYSGAGKSKFGYLSPEQVRGLPIDNRSDLFSVGVCLWELLTLERLFSGEGEVTMIQKIRDCNVLPPSSLRPEIAADLDRIVMKALAKDVDERYHSAAELCSDLDGFARARGLIVDRARLSLYARRVFDPDTAQAASREEKSLMSERKAGSDLDVFEGLAKKKTQGPDEASTPVAPPAAPTTGGEGAFSRKATLLGMPIAARSSPGAPGPLSRGPTPPPSRLSAPPMSPGVPPASSSASSSSTSTVPLTGTAPRPGSLPGSPLPGTKLSTPLPAVPIPVPTSPTFPPPAPLPAEGTAAAAASTRAPGSTGPTSNAAAPGPRPPSGSLPAAAPATLPPVAKPVATPQPHASSTDAARAATPAHAGPEVEMDWDDDEKTTVFAKGEASEFEGVGIRPVSSETSAGSRLPATPAAVRTLAGPGLPHTQAPGTGSRLPPPPISHPLPSLGAPPPPAPGVQANPLARTQLMGRAGPTSPPPLGASLPAPPLVPQDLAPQLSIDSRSPTSPSPAPRSRFWMGLTAAAVVLGGFGLFAALPKSGKIAVFVSGAGGKPLEQFGVLLDGQPRCTSSPCAVEVERGVHAVRATAEGYISQEQGVTITSGAEVAVNFKLDKSAGGTGLRVAGKQAGVELFVDGKEIGPLPQELKDLAPGTHRLTFKGSDRYAQEDRLINLRADEVADLGTVALKIVRGRALFDVRTPGAKVTLVSGKERRQLTEFSQPVEIETARGWQVEATKVGFEDYRAPLTFEDSIEKTFVLELQDKGKPAPVAVAQAPRAPSPTPSPAPAAPKEEPAAETASGTCTLNLNSLPVSNVVLDGRPLGMTPKVGVSVPVGSHTVAFIHPDEGKKTQSVTCKSGETKTVAVRLNAQ